MRSSLAGSIDAVGPIALAIVAAQVGLAAGIRFGSPALLMMSADFRLGTTAKSRRIDAFPFR
jgi:hypothetical protein